MASNHDDFHVVLLDDLQPTPGEWRQAGIGTALIHLALLLVLLSIPKDAAETPLPPPPRRLTNLIDPPARLTQRARNKAPVSEDISIAPQQELRQKEPARAVAVTKKRFAPPPRLQVAAKPAPAQEPPRIKPAPPPQSVQLALPPVVTPPPPSPGQPEIALQNLPPAPQTGHGTGLLKVPSGDVQDVVKELSRKSAPPARTVGDDTEEGVSRSSGAFAAARPKSSLELLSDPQGIDMKPYLLQVLQSVRRNWLSIYPESARLGQRGRVVVQFAIAPNGKITKVVFTSESQAHALNQASVAALSMSDPLPQLPAGFKGDRVVLQFTFLYNAPR